MKSPLPCPFHPGAETDLNEIWEYLTEATIDLAESVIADIERGIQTLVLFPRSGKKGWGMTGRPMRFSLVRRFLIGYAPHNYEPDKKPLWIIAVLSNDSIRRGEWASIEPISEMLDARYDEIKSRRVKLIPGDEVFTRLREKRAAHVGVEPHVRVSTE